MDREFFAADALEVAPQFLGAVLGLSSPEGTVRLPASPPGC
ncbi:hypothetical protein SLW73_07750 [Glutamicibacter protophormiae]|nr:hypothetical protein [Glutamicibacter protophormiae]WPR66194.1 hypothetical protein SLW72_07755 [Glutamicibacter protophormiae]WPR69690.1 hypothetical protein SLW73_07750 [Glutamicibacter protophormiae]